MILQGKYEVKAPRNCLYLPFLWRILQAIVVFIISIHAYAGEKSETEQVAMVALSGCIWLQAFVVALETK